MYNRFIFLFIFLSSNFANAVSFEIQSQQKAVVDNAATIQLKNESSVQREAERSRSQIGLEFGAQNFSAMSFSGRDGGIALYNDQSAPSVALRFQYLPVNFYGDLGVATSLGYSFFNSQGYRASATAVTVNEERATLHIAPANLLLKWESFEYKNSGLQLSLAAGVTHWYVEQAGLDQLNGSDRLTGFASELALLLNTQSVGWTDSWNPIHLGLGFRQYDLNNKDMKTFASSSQSYFLNGSVEL